MPELDATIRIRLETSEAKRDAERAGKDKDKVEKRREKKKEREKKRGGVLATVGGARKGIRGVAAKTAGIIGSLYLLSIAGPAIAGFTTELLDPLIPGDIIEKKIRRWVNEVVANTLTPIITAARAALPAIEQTRQLAGATAILGGKEDFEGAFANFQQLFAIRRAQMTGELAVERLTKEMFGVLIAKALKHGIAELVGAGEIDAETQTKLVSPRVAEAIRGTGPAADIDIEKDVFRIFGDGLRRFF